MNRPIKALIIRPDRTYDVQQINQDLPTLQGLVGGYLEAVTTGQAVLWVNEEGKLKALPLNRMATYLWWTLNPAMEGVDTIAGCCVVTGPADPDGHMTSIPEAVLDEYGRLEGVRRDRDRSSVF